MQNTNKHFCSNTYLTINEYLLSLFLFLLPKPEKLSDSHLKIAKIMGKLALCKIRQDYES